MMIVTWYVAVKFSVTTNILIMFVESPGRYVGAGAVQTLA